MSWIFYSDCGEIEHCPPNIVVKHLSFSEYCRIVSDSLDVNFAPSSPYKLCDIKPMLGFIHQSDLQGFDFWAFGDIDLILGNLRNYFTAERLVQKDVLSTHARRISGHMCLIRNSPSLNTLFMRIPDWEKLISEDKHLAVDEGPFTRLFLRYKNLPRFIMQPLNYLLNPFFRRAEFVEAFSTPDAKLNWHDGTHNFPKCWTWREGKLTNDIDGEREFPYLHFLVWKREWRRSGTIACVLEAKESRSPLISFDISRAGFRCAA